MSINNKNVKDIKLIDKIIDGTQGIVYDPTISGLASVTVKTAIDELKVLNDNYKQSSLSDALAITLMLG